MKIIAKTLATLAAATLIACSGAPSDPPPQGPTEPTSAPAPAPEGTVSPQRKPRDPGGDYCPLPMQACQQQDFPYGTYCAFVCTY